MSDPAELQAKIIALQGRINKRKQHHPTQCGGRHFAQDATRGNARWAPFDRGGRPRHHQTHKNRVLVLGGGQPTGAVDRESAPSTPASQALISGQAAAMGQPHPVTSSAQEQKQLQPNPYPSTRPNPATSIPPIPTKAAAEPARELVIDGIRFQIHAGGSKLIRITDSATAAKKTPKIAKVADVQFLRTKHGNLIRAAPGKKRYCGKDGLYMEDLDLPERHRSRLQVPQCENFTKHGTCSFGPACRFTHDPTKVAICKDFMRTGACKAGRSCDLSHEPTYHRVPACTHFLRGNCTNSACRYPHVNVSPAASVCRPFATLGFCSKGADCEKRHVVECPDYANHGRCANREKNACNLPHIDRAGALRKAAERQAKTGSEDDSDVSSSDDDKNEGDSDVAEDIDMDDDSHELSQQQDFIAFS
ncbi:hypothetical protein M409DRAFT_16965 [Zasmidium cellare ATCC 36951]|uniref:C3H1-type domain-containing protein n=1 Tax=Zasmidium cellare ATCC 36951 TaxID=1080233 RepID=A0A6A6D1G4_ZASCE|nr:uncharacterized protein M409DRAFT_16965 [Zasmidium cellare ATCC 36951]KAF2173015.1 hypothetical protein M409DRAFT_16965 [Zasmidium cellare ATCC 36951]